MAIPDNVKSALEAVLSKNLRLTKRFGGPVDFSWRGNTIFVFLAKEKTDPNKCWAENQAFGLAAKFIGPRATWIITQNYGRTATPKSVPTLALLDYLTFIFSVARTYNVAPTPIEAEARKALQEIANALSDSARYCLRWDEPDLTAFAPPASIEGIRTLQREAGLEFRAVL